MANTIGVFFMRTDKPMNSTLKLEGGEQYECVIKDNNSIIEPEIMVKCDDPSVLHEYNYMIIPFYGDRKYFITDIWSEASRLWWVKGTVDVLGTYRDDILETRAFIQYSESAYNSFVYDPRLKITDSSSWFSVEEKVPDFDQEGSFIVTIASKEATGATGPAQAYVMTVDQMHELAEKLNDTSLWTGMVNEWFGKPLDSICSAIWIPVKRSRIMMVTDSTIEINGRQVGHGAPCSVRFDGEIEITPHVHYKSEVMIPPSMTLIESWADYRNVEPYSEYFIWLPGAGLTEIPMLPLIGTGGEEPTFKVFYEVSTVTGEVHYSIRRTKNLDSTVELGDKVLEATGYFGVSLPVSASSKDWSNTISSLMSGALSIGISFIPGVGPAASGIMAASGVGEVASGSLQATYTNRTVRGAMGGFLMNKTEIENIKCMTLVHGLTDNPSNIADTIGRPLYASRKLGNLNGLVKCSGAYVRANGATRDEQERIAQLVNSSTNFIYGGVIIE